MSVGQKMGICRKEVFVSFGSYGSTRSSWLPRRSWNPSQFDNARDSSRSTCKHALLGTWMPRRWFVGAVLKDPGWVTSSPFRTPGALGLGILTCMESVGNYLVNDFIDRSGNLGSSCG